MTSPTKRTMKHLDSLGIPAQIVERWQRTAFGGVRIDLCGCIDIVAFFPDRIVGIQTCSGSGGAHAERRAKALNPPVDGRKPRKDGTVRTRKPTLQDWLSGGGEYEIWSWAKRGARGKRKTWTLRREELSSPAPVRAEGG